MASQFDSDEEFDEVGDEGAATATASSGTGAGLAADTAAANGGNGASASSNGAAAAELDLSGCRRLLPNGSSLLPTKRRREGFVDPKMIVDQTLPKHLNNVLASDGDEPPRPLSEGLKGWKGLDGANGSRPNGSPPAEHLQLLARLLDGDDGRVGDSLSSSPMCYLQWLEHGLTKTGNLDVSLVEEEEALVAQLEEETAELRAQVQQQALSQHKVLLNLGACHKQSVDGTKQAGTIRDAVNRLKHLFPELAGITIPGKDSDTDDQEGDVMDTDGECRVHIVVPLGCECRVHIAVPVGRE